MINYDWHYKKSADLAVLNNKETDAVCRADGLVVSENADKYLARNGEQYYIAINVWLNLAADLGGNGFAIQTYIAHTIKARGLLGTIKHCNDFALVLINGDSIEPCYAYLSDALTGTPLKESLQILRVLKRFTPALTDKLTDQKLQSFIQVNRGLLDKYVVASDRLRGDYWRKDVSYEGTPDALPTVPVWRDHSHLYTDLANIISKMLRGFKTPSVEKGTYTNGASADCCTCVFCKKLNEMALLGQLPLLDSAYRDFHPRFAFETRNYMLNVGPVRRRPLDKRHQEFYATKVIAVPKDYKGPRLISPESFDRQYVMKAYAAELERCLIRNGYGKHIPLHDQTVNQGFAYQGSIDGDYATIDLSHASDSVTKELVARIFPEEIARTVWAVMPSHVNVGGVYYPMHMYGTMGSALTFIIESIVFCAIAQLSVEYSAVFNGKRPSKEFTSYGDDIIVPAESAATCLDLLEILGFEVNTDKTYYSGPYRESCGEEYFNGDCLTSVYWPRKDMSRDTTSWDGFNEVYESRDASWLNLANRIYTVTSARPNFCNAHNFLRLWLQEKFKVVCVPPQYAPVGALWGDNLLPKARDIAVPSDAEDKFSAPPSKPFDTTWDSFADHPSWRYRYTTATQRRYEAAKQKPTCICRQLTQEMLYAFWEYISYQDWLMHGPQYEEPLLEFLHIPSRSRMTFDEANGKYNMTFRTSYNG